MSGKVREAKIRLSADYVNRLAVNLFAIGVLTPLAAVAFGKLSLGGLEILGIMTAFLVSSWVFQYLARQMLNRIDK